MSGRSGEEIVLNGFTEAERYVLAAIDCLWIKSWVVFQRLCLKDPIGFVRVKLGNSKPWYRHDTNYNYRWDYSLYGSPGEVLDFIHKFYVNIEWTKMMDAWVFFCFRIEGFEVFDTLTMGLGLKTTRRINMNELSSKIAGFLGLVNMQQFMKLEELMYPSLYHFDVEQPLPDNVLAKRAQSETYYCILFGPLALCNTCKGVDTQFCHFDNRLGDPLLWKVKLLIMNEHGECRQQTCTSFESLDSFSVSDGKRKPDGKNYAPYGVEDMKDLQEPCIQNEQNSYSKSKLFVKVILHLRHTKKFETIKYNCGDEIFIAYKLTDE